MTKMSVDCRNINILIFDKQHNPGGGCSAITAQPGGSATCGRASLEIKNKNKGGRWFRKTSARLRPICGRRSGPNLSPLFVSSERQCSDPVKRLSVKQADIRTAHDLCWNRRWRNRWAFAAGLGDRAPV